MTATLPFVVLGAYLVVWCLAMWRNRMYLGIQRMIAQAMRTAAPQADELPPMTVVVTAHEQGEALRRHLPTILEQEYPQPFEVLVVDMNSTDSTRQYLESLASSYPHLHTIRLPESVRNVSPIRLALTLAFRAAAHEWVTITQADCCPSSLQWLARMGQMCSRQPDTQIVCGHTQFVAAGGWNGLRCLFFRTWQQMLHLPYADRNGAYRADGTNLCYRRSLFLSHRGFAEDANLLVGATDIMVNLHSTPSNTRLCLHPDAFMLQDSPQYPRWWHRERLFFMETRTHFRRRSLYRLRYLGHVLLTWLFSLSTLAAVLVPLLFSRAYEVPIVVGLLWMTHFVVRLLYYGRAATALAARPMPLLLPLLLHWVAVWDASAWLQWRFANKQLFQKKFI